MNLSNNSDSFLKMRCKIDSKYDSNVLFSLILFLVLLYVFYFIPLVIPQIETVTMSNITPSLFNQLYFEHGENFYVHVLQLLYLTKPSLAIIFHFILYVQVFLLVRMD